MKTTDMKTSKKIKKTMTTVFALALAGIFLSSGELVQAKTTAPGFVAPGFAASAPDLNAVISSRMSAQFKDDVVLTDQQMTQVKALVMRQSQIWSDTILDGDFEAAGDTRIDRIQGVFEGAQLVGYHVTYSETAWYTGHCDYDPKNQTTLSSCVPGRISESAFLKADLSDVERDEQDDAHFLN